MQPTANFHNLIPRANTVQPHPVFAYPAALNPTIDLFNAHATGGQASILSLVLDGQWCAAWCAMRCLGQHTCKGEPQKSPILQKTTAQRKGIAGLVRQFFVGDRSRHGGTQPVNAHRRGTQQQIFYRVGLFLAAIMALLFIRVLGTGKGSLGAIVDKRGANDCWREGAPAAEVRAGASPCCCKAVCKTGSSW